MATNQSEKLNKYRYVLSLSFETEAREPYRGLVRVNGLLSEKFPNSEYQYDGVTVKVTRKGLTTWNQIYDDEVVELRTENERLKSALKYEIRQRDGVVIDDVEAPSNVVAEVEALLKKKQP